MSTSAPQPIAPADSQSLIMAVGEMRGQMRELVHATNNNTQALNSMAVSVAKLEVIPAEIIEFKAQVAALEKRVDVLEAADQKRKGAIGFWAWFIQSPAIGWLATAGIGAWALLQGKTGQ